MNCIWQNNVLINENGQACLTDFGLSSMMKPGEKFQYLRPDGKQAGDLRWSAPELINYVDGEMYVPSPSSDIYSYGWIMYEVRSSGSRKSKQISLIRLRFYQVACLRWTCGRS